jgi:hypothetical protein
VYYLLSGQDTAALKERLEDAGDLATDKDSDVGALLLRFVCSYHVAPDVECRPLIYICMMLFLSGQPLVLRAGVHWLQTGCPEPP